MKTLMIILLFLCFAGNAFAEYGFYTGIAVGYHNESYDCPEVCFRSDVLFKAAFGYDFNSGIYLEVEHVSGKHGEYGYGLNAAWIGYKRYWDFW